MYQFLETIRVNNSLLENIELHQTRVELTFQKYYSSVCPFDLKNILKIEKTLVGIHKLRFLYNKDEFIYEILPYALKNISKVKLIQNNDINYSLKFLNRDFFDNLKNEHNAYDDFIIVKNDFLTDCTYANLVFFDNKEFFTPISPLLKGTMRQKLVNLNFIKEAEITINNFKNYSKFMLINAMLPFEKNRLLDTSVIEL